MSSSGSIRHIFTSQSSHSNFLHSTQFWEGVSMITLGDHWSLYEDRIYFPYAFHLIFPVFPSCFHGSTSPFYLFFLLDLVCTLSYIQDGPRSMVRQTFTKNESKNSLKIQFLRRGQMLYRSKISLMSKSGDNFVISNSTPCILLHFSFFLNRSCMMISL